MIKENKGLGLMLLAAGALALLTRKKTYVYAATSTHFVEVDKRTKDPIQVGSTYPQIKYEENQFVGEAIQIEKPDQNGKYPIGDEFPYILVRTPAGVYHWLPSNPGYLVNLTTNKD